MIKLNLGCGMQVVNGWKNVDYSLGARLLKSRFFRLLNKKLNIFKVNFFSSCPPRNIKILLLFINK